MKRMSLSVVVAVCVQVSSAGLAARAAGLEIGWGEADITPPTTKRIPLCGQYYQRLADEANPYHSRLKFVALADRKSVV